MAHMRHIDRDTIVCECCNYEKPWSERDPEFKFIDICKRCNAEFAMSERAHQTNGGTYS